MIDISSLAFGEIGGEVVSYQAERGVTASLQGIINNVQCWNSEGSLGCVSYVHARGTK